MTRGIDVRRVLLAWAAGRAVCVAAAWAWPSPLSVTQRLVRYDGAYYVDLAARGYPRAVPTRLGGGNTTAFFPGYPLLVRALHAVTRLGYARAALAVTLVAGALATLAVGALVAQVADRRTGTVAGVAFALLPTSWLLSTDYSEALFVLLAALSLLLLLRDRPLLSGLAASGAAVVRPLGLALVVVLAVEAVRHRSRSRAAAALVAASLPALHLAYLARHTGHADAWTRSERVGWGAHEDFGLATVKMVASATLHPFRHPWFDVVALVVVATIGLLFLATYDRLPWPLLLYSGLVLALGLTSGVATYSSYPRIAYTAVPLLAPLARRVRLGLPLAAASLAGAGVLATVIATSHRIVP
jgi:hypothetical protein